MRRYGLSPEKTDALVRLILGPDLEAATLRLIAYAAVGSAVVALAISLLF